MSPSEPPHIEGGPPPGGGSFISCLTDRASFFLFSYSPQHKALLSWSKNAFDVLGVKDSAIARDGNLFLRHVHPDDRFLLFTDLEQALKGDHDYRATYRWLRPDTNEVRWLHCRAAVGKTGNETSFDGIIVDLSDEFTGPVSRFAGPDSIATILAAFPTMVFILDKDLRLLRINRPKDKAWFRFGDPQFNIETFKIGRSLLTCFSDAEKQTHYERAMNAVLSGEIPYSQKRVSSDDSDYNLEIHPLLERGAIEGILVTVSDISELVRTERALADLQKAEGLRLLASGVAHNFNNALQGIMGHAAVLSSHSNNPELVREAGQAILDIVGRASNLSKQLFGAEDSSASVLTSVDINLAAMAAVNRIDNLFSDGIKIGASFGNPPPVLAKQESIIQSIEAVIRNAKESMPQGGTISIRTFEVTLAEREIEDLLPGRYAKLSISDTGAGMGQNTLTRCLEPFFTTKNTQAVQSVDLKGRGLGLSQVYAIVRDFGGALTVESQQGLGTTVALYFPMEQRDARSAGSAQRSEPLLIRQPEILIVDDDLIVLQTVQAILKESGYSCVAAQDGPSALSLFQKHKNSIQLALLDAIMPGLDGATLLKRLKKVNPSLKVLGFSGAPREYTDQLLSAGALQVLRKPVDPKLLRETVQATLSTLRAA